MQQVVNNIDLRTDPRFSIINIATLLNIKILGQSGAETIARCPFCGDSKNPRNGHLYLNTATNQYYCVRCGTGGYAISLYSKMLGISNYEAICDIATGSVTRINHSPAPLFYEENEIAPLEERHVVYSELLNLLHLDSDHIENLTARGLPLQYIAEKRYRSVPTEDEAVEITKKLLSMGLSIKGVPGFYKNDQGDWTFLTHGGYFIPVRDYEGKIQGLQIRCNRASGKRYIWFSSRKYNEGTRAKSWAHIARGHKEFLIITEGPLKADVASYFSGATFIGVPGVNAIQGIVEAINSIPRKYRQQIYVAYDMDLKTNIHIKNAQKKLLTLLKENFPKTKIHPLNWPLDHGKGIDDYYYYLATTKEQKRNLA